MSKSKSKSGRRYSSRTKFQVVLELLRGRPAAQVSRAHDVHVMTMAAWKERFLAQGPGIFEEEAASSAMSKRVAELERLLGQKEVEIALLKNFLEGDR